MPRIPIFRDGVQINDPATPAVGASSATELLFAPSAFRVPDAIPTPLPVPSPSAVGGFGPAGPVQPRPRTTPDLEGLGQLMKVIGAVPAERREQAVRAFSNLALEYQRQGLSITDGLRAVRDRVANDPVMRLAAASRADVLKPPSPFDMLEGGGGRRIGTVVGPATGTGIGAAIGKGIEGMLDGLLGDENTKPPNPAAARLDGGPRPDATGAAQPGSRIEPSPISPPLVPPDRLLNESPDTDDSDDDDETGKDEAVGEGPKSDDDGDEEGKPDKTVGEVLEGKRGSIKRVRLRKGSPSFDDIRDVPMSEVQKRAQRNEPSFKTFWKLLNSKRFNK